MPNQNRPSLDELILDAVRLARASQPHNRPLFGDAVKKIREALELSPTNFAHLLSISPATVFRWEKGIPPKEKGIHRLENLLEKQKNVPRAKNPRENGMIGIRNLEHIQLCCEDAEAVWFMGTWNSFLACVTGSARSHLLDMISRPSPQPPHVYFVYPSENRYSSSTSFEELKSVIERSESRTLQNRFRTYIHGCALDAQHCNDWELLLTTGWTLIRHLANPRRPQFTLFMEVPVSHYTKHNECDPSHTSVIWVELPPNETKRIVDRWVHVLPNLDRPKPQ